MYFLAENDRPRKQTINKRQTRLNGIIPSTETNIEEVIVTFTDPCEAVEEPEIQPTVPVVIADGRREEVRLAAAFAAAPHRRLLPIQQLLFAMAATTLSLHTQRG